MKDAIWFTSVLFSAFLPLGCLALDSDSDGMTDDFEVEHGFGPYTYDEFHKITLNAPDWSPSTRASADITGVRTEYTCTCDTNVTFVNLHAGLRLVLEIDFQSPLIVSSNIPSWFSMSVDCQKPGSVGFASASSNTFASVGTMPLRLNNAGFYTRGGQPGTICAFWMNVADSSSFLSGQYCTSVVASLVVNDGYALDNEIVMDKITFRTGTSGYYPETPYPDFPVRAVPPLSVAPPIDLRVFNAVEVGFDTAVGFTYHVEERADLTNETWQAIDDIFGTGSPITRHYRTTKPSSFYRVTLDPIQ